MWGSEGRSPSARRSISGRTTSSGKFSGRRDAARRNLGCRNGILTEVESRGRYERAELEQRRLRAQAGVRYDACRRGFKPHASQILQSPAGGIDSQTSLVTRMSTLCAARREELPGSHYRLRARLARTSNLHRRHPGPSPRRDGARLRGDKSYRRETTSVVTGHPSLTFRLLSVPCGGFVRSGRSSG